MSDKRKAKAATIAARKSRAIKRGALSTTKAGRAR